jgi:predicted nucleic acid-binding protein
MPRFVLDASVTLPWCFKDEANFYSESIFQTLKREYAVTTALWPFEVASTLATAERKGRITQSDTKTFLERLWRLPVQVELHPAMWVCQETLELTRRFRLTAYDASYVALAQRMNLPLATLDDDMRTAATTVGVRLFGESIASPPALS